LPATVMRMRQLGGRLVRRPSKQDDGAAAEGGCGILERHHSMFPRERRAHARKAVAAAGTPVPRWISRAVAGCVTFREFARQGSREALDRYCSKGIGPTRKKKSSARKHSGITQYYLFMAQAARCRRKGYPRTIAVSQPSPTLSRRLAVCEQTLRGESVFVRF